MEEGQALPWLTLHAYTILYPFQVMQGTSQMFGAKQVQENRFSPNVEPLHDGFSHAAKGGAQLAEQTS